MSIRLEADLAEALQALLDAAQRTMELWLEHGLGDDEDQSFPVFRDLNYAILRAETLLAPEPETGEVPDYSNACFDGDRPAFEEGL